MVAAPPEYLVNHGKTGALGRFMAEGAARYLRGDRVLLRSNRGLSVGVVLCEANDRHRRLLGPEDCGQLVRRLDLGDEAEQNAVKAREQEVFEASSLLAVKLRLPLAILDCEMSLDGKSVIIQYVLAVSCDLAGLIEGVAERFGLQVWLENLVVPQTQEQQHGGCGEPDCGRASGGGGCESCGSGGCSSCGSGKVDMGAYFAHLRKKMEDRRMPLL